MPPRASSSLAFELVVPAHGGAHAPRKSEGIRNLRELRETQTKTVGELEVLPSRIAPGRRLGFATYEPSFDALTDYIEASPMLPR